MGDFPIAVQAPAGNSSINASALFSSTFLQNFTQASANLLVSLLNQSRAEVTADGAIVADPYLTGKYMVLAPAGSVDPSAYQQIYSAGVITSTPSLQIVSTDWNAVAPGAAVPGPAAPVVAPAAVSPASSSFPAWVNPAWTNVATASAINQIISWLSTNVATVQSDGSVIQTSNGSILAVAGSVNPGLYGYATGKVVPAPASPVATGIAGLTSLATSIATISSLFGGNSAVPAATASPIASPPVAPPALPALPAADGTSILAPPAPPAAPAFPSVTIQPAPVSPAATAAPATGGLSAADLAGIISSLTGSVSPPPAAPAAPVVAPVPTAPATGMDKWLIPGILAGGVILFITLRPRGRRR